MDGRAVSRRGLGYIFKAALEATPGKVAIYQGDVAMTYRQLDERANRVANALRDAGIVRGDRIALLFDNHYRYIESSLGIMRSGAVAVPINPRLGNDAIAYIIEHSDAKMLFCSPNETLRGIGLAAPVGAVHLVVGYRADGDEPLPDGVVEFDAWLATTSAEPPDASIDVFGDAFQPYTSGSTGRPKGCVLNHDGQIWNTKVHVDFLGYTAADRSIAAAPLSHKNAMTGAVKPMLYVGGSVVILPRFDPEAYIAAIDRFKVTYTTGVPAMYNMIFARPELFERYDVSSVRIATVGSSSVAPELLRLLQRYFPQAHVSEIYGSTEGGPVTLIQPLDDTPGLGAVAETEIRIVRDDETDCSDEEVGELIVRNRGVLREYYKNPEVSAKRIREGWYYTSDLAKRAASGRYFIMGRTDDMIITAAENVYPIEVEDLLRRYPDVLDACVVPIPHAVKGQVPVAFVVLRRGAREDEQVLKAFALEHGPAFAHPRRVFFLEQIPLSGPGKVDRKKLCELAEAMVAEGGPANIPSLER
ncbi:MAG TPA: class I adenylate-forming enzyme family protein [Candidatus Dormibacteraeota bacterium]|nr:class I adenylate-forming enzyme family protein [Candidatus Dormibacteraeota bacterium]